MYLIVGLGNPGNEYAQTRHNVGFDFIDDLIKKIDFPVGSITLKNQSKFESIIGETTVDGEKIILAKPQTFMNLSGQAVKKITDFYKISNENIIVACDDANMELGKTRIKISGEDGGHNGLKSIISSVGPNFWRVRIGIGQGNIALENYVLAKFSADERQNIDLAIDKATQEVINSLSKNYLENKTI